MTSHIETFGEFITRKRKELNKSQSDVALEVGCYPSSLYAYENDQSEPPPHIREGILKVLEVNDPPEFDEGRAQIAPLLRRMGANRRFRVRVFDMLHLREQDFVLAAREVDRKWGKRR